MYSITVFVYYICQFFVIVSLPLYVYTTNRKHLNLLKIFISLTQAFISVS